MKLLPYGGRALLAQPADRDLVLALADALRGHDEVAEVVPAARTVLVRAASHAAMRGLPDLIRSVAADLTPATTQVGPEQVLDVRYDGADLADTAAELGLDTDGLVRAHSGAEYVVAFCGFAPGFAYLRGLPRNVQVPRRDQPRIRVPAGSVGIAGEFTGVYPRASPGGWRLLGHTDAPLWDLDRPAPALLSPGTRVRFRPR